LQELSKNSFLTAPEIWKMYPLW